MSEPIKVALLSHAGGAHVGAYLSALAETEACGSVVLGDPDGRWEAECREKLGDKLTKVYGNVPQLLDVEQPKLALISMEAKVAPPVIDAASLCGCAATGGEMGARSLCKCGLIGFSPSIALQP